MLGLFYKDFLVMKKELLLNGLVIAACSVLLFLPWEKILEKNNASTSVIDGAGMTFVIMPVIVYLFLFCIISGLQDNLFAHDEKKCFQAFVAASPVTGNGQVLSKYYEALLFSFSGVVWGMICDMISSLVSGMTGSAMTIYLSLFFIQIFLRAVEMPFLFCFGHKYGKKVKILLFSVIVFACIVYGLFGRLPNADSVMDHVMNGLAGEKSRSTLLLGAAALFPYLSVGMYYLSYKVSCRFYQKGVESYDA